MVTQRMDMAMVVVGLAMQLLTPLKLVVQALVVL
jgi:hypothetical protein